MTAIAKALVFLTLVAGVGAAVFATAVYTQRPGWFDEPPDGPIAKGHVVLSFKQLAKEIDGQGKAGAAASALWGRRAGELEAEERDQKARAAAYAKLLTTARTGRVGFFDIKDADDGRLDVVDADGSPKAQTAVVLGPDKQPLAGAETLKAKIATSIDTVANDLTPKIAKHRSDQARLGTDVELFTAKVNRQRVIRTDLQNEAAYLAAAGVNVAEQQKTAGDRRRQLAGRLKAFRPLD